MSKKNLIGQRFNRLTVLSFDKTTKRGESSWQCICDCGRYTKLVSALLISGHTKSCGCLRGRSTKHNDTINRKRTREYECWNAIRARCYNPNHFGYKFYGARGIKVCDRWLNSYQSFLDDMGRKPSDEHSIDRIDSHGDYSPENCRWATKKEQSQNRRNVIKITYHGVTKSLVEWAESFNIKYTTAKNRFYAGRSIDEILTVSNLKKQIK